MMTPEIEGFNGFVYRGQIFLFREWIKDRAECDATLQDYYKQFENETKNSIPTAAPYSPYKRTPSPS